MRSSHRQHFRAHGRHDPRTFVDSARAFAKPPKEMELMADSDAPHTIASASGSERWG